MALFQRLVFILALAQASSLAFGADVFIRHNINGSDLGFDSALPVDIEVNGACLAQGVTFDAQLGPVSLDPGQYDVQVKLSDGACGGTTVIVDQFNVQFAENLSVVAHLSETQTPTLSVFRNNVKPIDAHNSRVSLRHTADAPPVKIYLVSNRRVRAIYSLENGEIATGDLPSGHYKVYIYSLETGFARTQVVRPIPVDLTAQSNLSFYAVGSTTAKSFTVKAQAVE